MGISAEKGSRLFIYYGLCSAIGRLLAGILCNYKKVNTFFVFQAAEVVAGLSTILVTLTTTYTSLVIYVAVYGLSDGFFFTSLSVILLTASPLKTAAVLGWEMMVVSLFLASGPPLAGKAGVLLFNRGHCLYRNTKSLFGHKEFIWTPSGSPFGHRASIWTQGVHLDTGSPFGHRQFIWTQVFHLDTGVHLDIGSPFGHRESIWTPGVYLNIGRLF